MDQFNNSARNSSKITTGLRSTKQFLSNSKIFLYNEKNIESIAFD